MLDHVTFDVSNIDRSKIFYVHALKQLDYEIFMEEDKRLGFAIDGKPNLWLHQGISSNPGMHVAFRAHNRLLVDKFYKAAIAAGGIDNGVPCIREFTIHIVMVLLF
jgi:catechol 2,3-dioxygenase-like lactoylglutathione lyase family enzyme